MTSIADKARHVRAAMIEGHTGEHVCHWPGCGKRVPPAQWGCRAHWFKLPRAIRNAIWLAYRSGQEINKTPSAAYIEAARAAEVWITANTSPEPGRLL